MKANAFMYRNITVYAVLSVVFFFYPAYIFILSSTPLFL